jgi:hypothetical protein
MHCPNCGTRAAADQKFCRSCGFSLEKVAQLLTEQTSVTISGQISEEDITRLQSRLKIVERLWRYALVVLGTTLVGAFILGIFNKMILERGMVVGGSLVIAFLLMGIAFVPVTLYIETRRKMIADLKPRQPALQPDAETTNPLPHESDPYSPLSVTEQTTARLEERTKTAS